LRNSAGVVLPLVAGLFLHHIPSGIIGATGALNVAFSDSLVPYIQRLRRMLAASLLVALGVFAGELCGGNRVLIMALSMVWAFAAGMLVAVDTVAADVGSVSLVTLAVYSAFPAPPATALASGALALCGGLLQTGLSVALWPLRRYAQQRETIGAFFEALAKSASVSAHAAGAPPTSAESTAAQDSLAGLENDHSIEAERYRALLSQAERIRLGLLVLARLRVRISRENPGDPVLPQLDQFFAVAAGVLHLLAGEVTGAEFPGPAAPLLEKTRALTEALRSHSGDMVLDARRQIDALGGQFRAALDLAGHALSAGAASFQKRESARPWRLRLKGTLATLRANLSLQSAACRHAIRLSVCVAVAEAVGPAVGFARAYWAPMTVIIVLKPDFASTFSRGVLRLIGTFTGLLLSTLLFYALPLEPALKIALIGVFAFVARAFGPANFGITATAITALVVLLLALAGFAPGNVVAARGIHTAIGGVIALTAYAIWPTWERTQLGHAIASLLDAYLAYFHALRLGHEHPAEAVPRSLDRLRLNGRRARSNLEASVDRLYAEPGVRPEQKQVLAALLANSHRLAHAFMALEAALITRTTAPSRPALGAFADSVEATLAALSAALRGAPANPGALPDLREAHHALVTQGEAAMPRYALINVETDRIVNSLNTLTEDVFRWIRLTTQVSSDWH
jgi:uncharacterized membrane protein YccC